MPDSKDPQEFDSGEQGQSEQEEIYLKKESIAEALSLGFLSHDNPSPRNRYTSLEQLILFEFDGVDNPDIKNELTEIKREVISISNSIDYLEYDMYDRDDIDEKAINIKIAKYVIRGYVTDDNISDIVGTTSLEQIIYFKYGPIGSKKFSEVKREIMSQQLNLRGGSVMSKYENMNDDYKEVRRI